MVVAEVQCEQIDECVVDEDGPLQLVVGEVKCLQIPLVHGIILVQQLDMVERSRELPEGAR